MQDFLVDEQEDLILSGDLMVGDSQEQHQKHLLIAQEGDYKAYPLVGVGINNQLADSTTTHTIEKIIKNAFEADGMKVKEINVIGTQIEINATYE